MFFINYSHPCSQILWPQKIQFIYYVYQHLKPRFRKWPEKIKLNIYLKRSNQFIFFLKKIATIKIDWLSLTSSISQIYKWIKLHVETLKHKQAWSKCYFIIIIFNYFIYLINPLPIKSTVANPKHDVWSFHGTIHYSFFKTFHCLKIICQCACNFYDI